MQNIQLQLIKIRVLQHVEVDRTETAIYFSPLISTPMSVYKERLANTIAKSRKTHVKAACRLNETSS